MIHEVNTDADALQKHFHHELKKRANDSAWDKKIAKKILQQRRSRQYRFLAAGAVAAMVLAVLSLSFVLTEEPDLRVDQFITQQIQGTYKEVYSAKKDFTLTAVSDDTALYSEVDDFIEDTLAQR